MCVWDRSGKFQISLHLLTKNICRVFCRDLYLWLSEIFRGHAFSFLWTWKGDREETGEYVMKRRQREDQRTWNWNVLKHFIHKNVQVQAIHTCVILINKQGWVCMYKNTSKKSFYNDFSVSTVEVNAKKCIWCWNSIYPVNKIWWIVY